MWMCYVDESGDTGQFLADERNSQPVFLLCALIVNQSRLEGMTREVIHLKQRYFKVSQLLPDAFVLVVEDASYKIKARRHDQGIKTPGLVNEDA